MSEETIEEPPVEVAAEEPQEAAGLDLVDQGSVPAGEAPEVPEAQEEAPAAPQRSPEAERAMNALRLRGSAPDAALDKLDDESLIGWADKVESSAKEVDRVYRDLAERKRESEELRKQVEEAAARTEQATPAVQEDPIDLSGLVELLGDDDETREVLERTVGQALKSSNERAARAEAQVQELAALMEANLLESTRAGLRDQFPALTDAAYYDRVVETMHQLQRVGRHADLRGPAQAQALMESAMRLEDPPEMPAPPDPVVQKAKRNGSPSDPTPSRAPKGPEPELSFEERLHKASRVLHANPSLLNDPVAAAKHLRQAQGMD